MNKRVKWIIIAILAIVIVTIAIISIRNEMLLHYKIEEISEYNYFVLEQNKKYGVIDKKGNVVIEANYETVKIPNPSKPVFVCIKEYDQDKKEYTTIVYNEKKEELFSNYNNVQAIAIFTNINSTPYEKNVLAYKENEKYGLIDLNGKVITKPIYDEISSVNYKEGTFVVKQNGLEGVINLKGKVIIKCEYESVTSDNYYSEKNNNEKAGFIVSKKTEDGYRYGYINYRGTKILNEEFTQLERVTEINDDNNMYFVAFKDGQAGLLKNKKIVLNYEYQDVQYDVLGDFFVIQRNGKFGAVTRTGESILYPKYTTIYTAGMYLNALEGKKIKVFDFKGNEIDTNIRSKIKTDNPNYCITVDKKGIYKVVNEKEYVIIDSNYNYAEYLPGDKFIVSKDSKSGVVNIEGRSILEIRYDSVSRINDTDIIQAEIDDTIELYDMNLNKIASMEKSTVKEVKGEKPYILLYSATDFKYIDKTGKIVEPQNIFEDHTLFSKNINGKWGFVDKNGNVKVQNEYEMVTEFNQYGFAGIKKDGKWGVIDQEGNVVQEPIYELSLIMPDFIGKYYKTNESYGDARYSDTIQGEK